MCYYITGETDGNRLPKLEALRYVAKNFLACQHFFQIYFEAFNAIFLGWPLGELKQLNPNCLFGIIDALQWSLEESGRRGIHGHCPMYVPVFQAANLRKLFEEGIVMQQQVLQFAESLAMAYMPSAYQQDDRRLHALPQVRS